MAEIKLFVCCHRQTPVPQYPILVPVQVGAALTEERLPGFLPDNTGENISAKNRSYCELTAQYWAWKNIEADYYGFFHYRRYLYPDEKDSRPYRIAGPPSAKTLDKRGFKTFADMIPQYDLILPKRENMCMSVRNHYAKSAFHHIEDLDLAEQIVWERSSEYRMEMEGYLAGTDCYFGNIYIMRREQFQAYCGWLFPVLEEFDRRVDLHGYTPQEQRVDGYLAERLLGMWVAAHRELRILELPRIHFVPDLTERWKKRAVNFLLPPGSRKRAEVKKLVSCLRGV